MKRTTIFVDDDLLLEAQHLAKQRETTFTQIVQEALRAYVRENRPARRISFIGIGRSSLPSHELQDGWDEKVLRAEVGDDGWPHRRGEPRTDAPSPVNETGVQTLSGARGLRAEDTPGDGDEVTTSNNTHGD